MPRRQRLLARPGSRSSDHLALPHVPDLVGGAAEPLAIDRLAIRAENWGTSQRDLGVRHPQRRECILSAQALPCLGIFFHTLRSIAVRGVHAKATGTRAFLPQHFAGAVTARQSTTT